MKVGKMNERRQRDHDDWRAEGCRVDPVEQVECGCGGTFLDHVVTCGN